MQCSLFEGKRTMKQRVYDLLKDGDWHNFRELNDICFRYSARLLELRKEGIDHEIKKVNGVNFYKIKDNK